jgi:hypothetical protein
MTGQIHFEDAEHPGTTVTVEADPQTAVLPTLTPGTTVIISPDGRRVCVVGDYRDVQVKIQAAAAQAHEAGEAPRQNTPVV